jgi:hypothetical protein
MKSIGWILLSLVVALSVGAWAQCDCGSLEVPDCYLAFRTTETIEFVLEAPVEYFMKYNTSVSPGIFGWRVETWDGNVVRTVIFPGEPVGRLTIMEWDLADESGTIVPPGFYNVIVMTTASDVSYPVRVVEACRTGCGCFCWCCAPRACDVPCCTPLGELYLTLGVGQTRSCCGLSFSLGITLEW